MSSNEIETNDLNASQLAQQGPRQGDIGRHHANPVIIERRKWSSQENKIVMERYLFSEPKIRGYRKGMVSLWLQKGMLWLSEERLVDTIRRNSRQTKLEIEELERKVTGSGNVIVEETRRVEVLPDHVEKNVRKFLPEIGTAKLADSLDEEEIAIVIEIADGIERGRKEK